jgi:hypothetical protein
MVTSRHIPDTADEFKGVPQLEVRASNADVKLHHEAIERQQWRGYMVMYAHDVSCISIVVAYVELGFRNISMLLRRNNQAYRTALTAAVALYSFYNNLKFTT